MGGRDPGRAGNGGDNHISRAQSRLDDGGRAGADFDAGSSQQCGERLITMRIGQHGAGGAQLNRHAGQSLRIPSANNGLDCKASRRGGDHVRRRATDGAGGAKNSQAARGASEGFQARIG